MNHSKIDNPNKEYVVQNLIVEDSSLEEKGITKDMLDEAGVYLFVPDEDVTENAQLDDMPKTLNAYRRYSAADPVMEIVDKSIIDGSGTEPGPAAPQWGSDDEVVQALAEHISVETINPHNVEYDQTGLEPMTNTDISSIIDDAFEEDGEL